MKRYDAAIIGFGKGGKTLAGALAAAGQTVALVEQSAKMYGGTCIGRDRRAAPYAPMYSSALWAAMRPVTVPMHSDEPLTA